MVCWKRSYIVLTFYTHTKKNLYTEDFKSVSTLVDTNIYEVLFSLFKVNVNRQVKTKINVYESSQ